MWTSAPWAAFFCRFPLPKCHSMTIETLMSVRLPLVGKTPFVLDPRPLTEASSLQAGRSASSLRCSDGTALYDADPRLKCALPHPRPTPRRVQCPNRAISGCFQPLPNFSSPSRLPPLAPYLCPRVLRRGFGGDRPSEGSRRQTRGPILRRNAAKCSNRAGNRPAEGAGIRDFSSSNNRSFRWGCGQR